MDFFLKNTQKKMEKELEMHRAEQYAIINKYAKAVQEADLVTDEAKMHIAYLFQLALEEKDVLKSVDYTKRAQSVIQEELDRIRKEK